MAIILNHTRGSDMFLLWEIVKTRKPAQCRIVFWQFLYLCSKVKP